MADYTAPIMSEIPFDFDSGGYAAPSFGEVPFRFNPLPSQLKYILAGTSNNFVAIWADATANLTNGKMYVSAQDAFSVVDLGDIALEDYYTETHAGRGGESLESNDIVDINVGG